MMEGMQNGGRTDLLMGSLSRDSVLVLQLKEVERTQTVQLVS